MLKYASFADFYPFYLSEHSRPATRRLHFLGSSLGLVCLLLLVLSGNLGPDDVPVSVVRSLFTQGEVIGASVGSIKEAASGEKADYWGIGPLNGSATKLDAGPSLGIAGFRQIVAQAGGRPCIAIGGVRPEDVRPVLEAGGAGVAVVSGILASEDVEAAVRKYLVPSTEYRVPSTEN